MTGRDRDVERQQVSYRNKRDVSAAPRPPHARLIREAYADHRLRLVKRCFVDPGRERIEDHPGPRLTKGDFELLKETLIQEPRHSTNDCGRLCCAPSASAGGAVSARNRLLCRRELDRDRHLEDVTASVTVGEAIERGSDALPYLRRLARYQRGYAHRR